MKIYKHQIIGHNDISPICRLIYFGGYGCKTMSEVQNAFPSSFIVEEMSWV